MEHVNTYSSSFVPIIDIGPLLKRSKFSDPPDADVERVVKQLDRACREIGFFHVVNHGILEDLVEAIRDASREFFSLDDREKEKIKMTSSTGFRGYQKLGLNVTKGRPDQHEAIDFFKEFAPHDLATPIVKPILAENQWPTHPEGFQTLFQEYISEMTDLARSIMRGIALALGGPCDSFEGNRAGNPFWILRVIGYPPKADLPDATKEEQENDAGCAEHTDYGLLTLVNQDPDVTALQVKTRDGKWIWVEPVVGAFVVNIGDMLKIWSNGIYPSTSHRVMNRDKYRVSVPFFYEPNFDAYVEPLEFCKDEAGENLIQTHVVYGEHLVRKVLTNFG